MFLAMRVMMSSKASSLSHTYTHLRRARGGAFIGGSDSSSSVVFPSGNTDDEQSDCSSVNSIIVIIM